MFGDQIVAAKQNKPRKWVGITVTVSLLLHATGGAAAVVYSFWKIEKLEPKYVAVSFVGTTAPPPPPPPPPPPKKSSSVKTEKKPRPTTEIVQPTKIEKPPENEDKGEDEG